jgi:hypothetical protein
MSRRKSRYCAKGLVNNPALTLHHRYLYEYTAMLVGGQPSRHLLVWSSHVYAWPPSEKLLHVLGTLVVNNSVFVKGI